jgi:hypothetical protein
VCLGHLNLVNCACISDSFAREGFIASINDRIYRMNSKMNPWINSVTVFGWLIQLLEIYSVLIPLGHFHAGKLQSLKFINNHGHVGCFFWCHGWISYCSRKYGRFQDRVKWEWFAVKKKKTMTQKPNISLMKRAAKQFICFGFIAKDQGQ